MEDDEKAIRKQVKKWIKDKEIDVVITTGGTGFTGRDVTPEAVKPLFEKEIDGFSALFHMLSYQTVGTSTVQSRACGGLGRRHFYLLPAGIAGRLRGRAGTASSCINSTIATAPAASSRSCRASRAWRGEKIP